MQTYTCTVYIYLGPAQLCVGHLFQCTPLGVSRLQTCVNPLPGVATLKLKLDLNTYDYV